MCCSVHKETNKTKNQTKKQWYAGSYNIKHKICYKHNVQNIITAQLDGASLGQSIIQGIVRPHDPESRRRHKGKAKGRCLSLPVRFSRNRNKCNDTVKVSEHYFLEQEIYPPCRKATKTDNCLSCVPFGDSGKDGSIHKLIIVQETLEFFSSRI